LKVTETTNKLKALKLVQSLFFALLKKALILQRNVFDKAKT